MTAEQKINAFLSEEQDKYEKHQLNPLATVQGATEILREACAKGRELDPVGEGNENAHNLHKRVTRFLFEKGYESAALDFLSKWWIDLGICQSSEDGSHIDRAIASMQMVDNYLDLGDRGAALRWALLTHADDILAGKDYQNCAGKQKLKAVLGMSDQELEEFELIGENNRNIIQTQDNIGWSDQRGFAEDIVVRFALKNPGFAHLLARESSIKEFPFSPGYFRKIRERAEIPVKSDNSPEGITTTEKGRRFEYLASYLFLLIPGWVPLRNREDLYQTFENDIVVRNFNESPYIADLVGRHFLAECKNWTTERVKASHIGYFLYRIQLTHAKFGVIFAWQGITGDNTQQPEERSARSLIRKAFHENGSLCVVVNKTHLEKLEKQKTTFWALLLELIEVFRFGEERASN